MSEFETLAKVIEISHLEEHVERKMIKISNFLKESLSLCDMHFLLYIEEENMFSLNYSTNKRLMGKFKKISADDGALLNVAHSISETYKNDFKPGSDFKSDIISSRSKCKHLFSLPIFNYLDFFGIVAGEKKSEFTKLDEKLLSLIIVEITGMVCNASSFIELSKKINEISTFFSISKLFTGSEELAELCNKIVRHISSLLYANSAFLELFVEGVQDITQKRYVFNKDKAYDINCPPISTIIENVKSSLRAVYIKDSKIDERCIGHKPDFLSALFVPIEYDSQVIGVIGLIDKETNFFMKDTHFSEDDFSILTSLANQLANFVENGIIAREKERISSENEMKTHELSILHDVSNAMMTTMKLDNLLHKVLTAVTTGGGLEFNRAGLLLINNRTNTLHGMLGIGPDSGEEAQRIWSELEKEPKTLTQQMSVDYDSVSIVGSEFDRNIKSIRISLDETDDALVKAVKERRPILVTEADDEHNRSEYLNKINTSFYAAVPLMAKDKVLGAIFVDNSITKSPITEESLDFLALFANQAGLAIENSTLYGNLKKINNELTDTHQKLMHSEKLAALGEMAADVAHEIKNPLVSIGGFARRLNKCFSEEDSNEKAYTDIIIKEVSRLEKILNEILNFSKEESINNFRCNCINSLINETLIMFDNEFLENNITVESFLQPNLNEIKCDYQQIKQAVINLLNNSCQAMLDGGKLAITTRKALLNNNDSVVIEISDTGGGVANDVLHNIFNPFFTTKDGGTGLGLAITHRLIVNHCGSVEVNNNPGIGVTFIINLPVSKDEALKAQGA